MTSNFSRRIDAIILNTAIALITPIVIMKNRIKRFIIGGLIVVSIVLPMIGCGNSDFGEIGSRIDAQATQTSNMPHINNGKPSAPPTPQCRNADGSYNC